MDFQILSIILWPRDTTFSFKQINFSPNKINVITGASRTGKSAIIPIIDYCLGAGTCRIPVETIRTACSWFGVIVKINENHILLARPEPGMQKSTDDMYIFESRSYPEVPNSPFKNTICKDVIERLNSILSISPLKIDTSEKISFRDLAAFTFQPQNIISNSNTLFFKADSNDHRKKLISLFPYVLGAVTPEILEKRSEVESLSKQLDYKEKELKAKQIISKKWIVQINGWLSTAKEYGLINDLKSDLNFNEQIDILDELTRKRIKDSNINGKRILESGKEIHQLQEEESEYSFELGVLKKRYREMERLKTIFGDYNSSLQSQIERLDISTWIKELILKNEAFISVDQVDYFCESLQKLERECELTRNIPLTVDREYNDLKKDINQLAEQLDAIQKRIKLQISSASSLEKEKYTLEDISRFLGKIEHARDIFKEIGDNSNLSNEIRELKEEINTLSSFFDARKIKENIEQAINIVNKYAMDLIRSLDCEWPEDELSLDIKNLSVFVNRSDGRKDYLWEIGSGSNWLSYHISTTLALQLFFRNDLNHSPVPNFLIYDQPSQVYFPTRQINTSGEDPKFVNDEDRLAVKKIFETFSLAIEKVTKPLQIIVLEHANQDVWGEIQHINKVAEWRGGEKLIPQEWINIQ